MVKAGRVEDLTPRRDFKVISSLNKQLYLHIKTGH